MSVAARIRAYRRPVLVALGCLFWGLLLASAWDLSGALPLDLSLSAFMLLFGIPLAMIVLTLLCGWSVVRVEYPHVIIVAATVIAVFLAFLWLLLFAGISV